VSCGSKWFLCLVRSQRCLFNSFPFFPSALNPGRSPQALCVPGIFKMGTIRINRCVEISMSFIFTFLTPASQHLLSLRSLCKRSRKEALTMTRGLAKKCFTGATPVFPLPFLFLVGQAAAGRRWDSMNPNSRFRAGRCFPLDLKPFFLMLAFLP